MKLAMLQLKFEVAPPGKPEALQTYIKGTP